MEFKVGQLIKARLGFYRQRGIRKGDTGIITKVSCLRTDGEPRYRVSWLIKPVPAATLWWGCDVLVPIEESDNGV